MSYVPPAPAPTSNTLNTAIIALVVVMAMTITALGAVLILGGTSEAASPAPAPAVAAAPPVAETAEVLNKQDPAAAQPVAEEAPAEAAAPAPAAPAPAAPAAPAPAAPAPQNFYPTCSTSKTFVEAGELFVISGTHAPQSVSVTWAFDHGDGFVDWRNPSTAYFEYPGTYNVTGIATANGAEKWVHCGTVTVTEPMLEFDCVIEDTVMAVNDETVFHAASNLPDLPIVYTFDHGDGYSEVANPSYATYYDAGTYNVSVTALYNGSLTHIDCGTVTVVRPSVVPITCPTESLIGMTEADAHAAVQAVFCTPITVVRDGAVFPVTGDYRAERVQLTVMAGTVVTATIG